MKEILLDKVIQLKSTIKLFVRNKYSILFLIIIFCSIILRFFEIEIRNPFGWDQLDNAWAAQKIIVNQDFPLIGMQAKGNSGIFIGPLYYYLISAVYFLTNLDPIASGIFAGITSIFSLTVLYFVAKNILNEKVALIAVIINTFSYAGIYFDRVQWPVNFIPPLSLLIFYCLYKIINNNEKFILLLSFFLGLSFHIHFTSIFYPIIILFCLPFFPRNLKSIKYSFFGVVILFILMSPILINFVSNMVNINNVSNYSNSYYHGFHLRRIMQLAGDAFIQFDFFLKFDFIKPLKFVLLPLFIIVYTFAKPSREKKLLSYLLVIFFLIPWLIMSTYSGELSDYYFSSNRFLAIIIISYFLYLTISRKSNIFKIVIALILFTCSYINVNEYLRSFPENNLVKHRQKALDAIKTGQKIEFREGVPEAYLYYYYMLKKGIKVY